MRARLLPESAQSSFLEFVRRQTRARRADDQPPRTLDEWKAARNTLREKLAYAYGEFPDHPCDLAPRVLGQIERDGYRIEKLIFQSRPGIWVTANAYVPTGVSGKVPAVLSVHGHWAWARVDPTPHARAVGLVKLGYFVLAVDAFGAGERAVIPARGTYHGALLGASTWPVGTPLLGLQIYDNMRAADYLISRPEVDGSKLAITGASGGGNQSMNAGAWDERFQAVIPVCSVGTYDAYLGAACCVCEALPGGLALAEEGTILGLVAPRALMVISATRDAFQFSVGEAAKSLERAKPIFAVYQAEDRLKHVVIDSGHDYNQPMREAMYGWLNKWLRGQGDGSPIPEPPLQIEDVDALRCFPDNVRPAEFRVLPEFVAEQGQRKFARLSQPDHREWWETEAMSMRERLEKQILGGLPFASPKVEAVKTEEDGARIEEAVILEVEPGLRLPSALVRSRTRRGPFPVALLVHPEGRHAALDSPLAADLVEAGWLVMSLDLRATGETAVPHDATAGVPDHNSTEWAHWMGRPLLGQWCADLLAASNYLMDRPDVDWSNLTIIGWNAAGLAAICATGLDSQIASAVAIGSLASLVANEPFAEQRMVNFVPFLLDVGDIPQLAALVAPRRLVLAGSVNHQNKRLSEEALAESWKATQRVYDFHGAAGRLTLVSDPNDLKLSGVLPGAR